MRKFVKRHLYGSLGYFRYFDIRVYFPRKSWSFRAACEQGIFESENVRLLQSLVKPDSWLFDVGTNIGLMSAPVLKSIDGVRVLSFEPSPNVVDYLQRTIAGSRYGDQWTLVKKAVGRTVGTVQFSLSSQELSLFDGIRPTKRVPMSRQVQVELTTIDVEWKNLKEPEVSMIKIDIEGGELDALYGALECIARNKPAILIEWNRDNLAAYCIPHDAILDFSKEFGYRIFSVPGMVQVTDPVELSLHMIETESFLLR